MPRIIVLDELSAEGLNLLESAGTIEVEVRTGLKGQALRDALMQADGAICRSGVKITAEVFAAAPLLKVVGRAGVGVDNVDVEAATERGVIVMNTPSGNTVATAELTFTHILCGARPVPQATPLPRQQSAIRDLALVVPDRVTHDALVSVAMADATGLLRSTQLFDLFKPKTPTAGIGADERSMAVRIELRDDDATLTDERIEAAIEAARARLQSQLGARLRA